MELYGAPVLVLINNNNNNLHQPLPCLHLKHSSNVQCAIQPTATTTITTTSITAATTTTRMYRIQATASCVLKWLGAGGMGHQNVHQRAPATQGLPCRHGRLTFHSCPTPLARRWGQRQHPRPRLQGLRPRRRRPRRRLSGTPTPIGMWRRNTPWKRSSTRTAPTFAVVQRCRCPGRTTHPTRSSAFRSPSTRPRCTRRPAWGRCTSAG